MLLLLEPLELTELLLLLQQEVLYEINVSLALRLCVRLKRVRQLGGARWRENHVLFVTNAALFQGYT